MPNSINKPKQRIQLHNKVLKKAIKRDARDRAGLFAPARSSAESKSGQAKSIALDLFRGELSAQGPMTTKTLSKKRAKKIERNLKYIQQRKLMVDVQSRKEGSMEVDDEIMVAPKAVHKTEGPVTKVKQVIWKRLQDEASYQHLPASTGTGTTLGGPQFV